MTRSSDNESGTLPKTFVLELTRDCNHRCSHCYAVWGAPAAAVANSRAGAPMTAREVEELVARLQDDAPIETIALSGGEPLLRDDLPEIVAMLSRRGISPAIITNGRLLTAEKADALAGASAFEITLFSHRSEVHDRLAGSPGAWEGAVQAMATLRQTRRDFVAVFVAARANSADLEDTAKLAIALGAYGLMYNRVNFGAHNLRHIARLAPTPAMIQANLDTLEALAQKYHLPVAVSVVVEPCVVDVSRYQNIHFGWCPLAGPEAYFTIDPSGNVRVCNHSPVELGNIRQGGFAEIYRNHPRVKAFRETWPEECAECDPNLKQMCRGGCKAAAEQCYGTLARVDPFVTWCREQNPGR